METTKTKKPVSLKYWSSGIFVLIGIVSLFQQQYFEVVVWLTIGLAMLLADMHYVPKGAEVSDVPPMPKWRRYLSIALMAIGMAAFGYIVGRDVKAKVERNQSSQTCSPQNHSASLMHEVVCLG